MKTRQIAYFMLLLMPVLSLNVWGYDELSDIKLNAITAGNASTEHPSELALTRIPFSYSNKKTSVEGQVIVLPVESHYEISNFQISDNAQSNLRSLININAVNSPVQILLNLNINVNSNIEQIKQINSLLSD